jgi:hypothetical protein
LQRAAGFSISKWVPFLFASGRRCYRVASEFAMTFDFRKFLREILNWPEATALVGAVGEVAARGEELLQQLAVLAEPAGQASRQIQVGWAALCHICGQPGADTAHHLIAKRDGGVDHPANLRAVHRGCHNAAHQRRGRGV